VLTDDYQRLDFVLVERYTVSTNVVQDTMTGFPSSARRQVSVRPRVLTVNRLKPGDVELRVMRRFSYTESDSFAQYDKLLSAYVVADWSEPFFNNRALFSDHYLTQRLPESPEWQDRTNAAAMTRAFQDLRNLYADARDTFANEPASVVRAKLSEPALAALGFAAQPVVRNDAAAPEPTYRLFAQADHGTASLLALCLAYPWGRSLDGKDDQRDSETPDDNPGAVVVSLLDRGEANWAIVTNGKIWRLYSAKAHSRATNYYEIDLEETLVQDRTHLEEAFRYFWFFFRAASFQLSERSIDGETRQICFLDSLVSDSERYAHDLGERLKERVFLEIFPHFARGFIIYARQTGQLPANLETLPDNERNALLEPFFSGTLTFLYRLLFLLYAESRDLLPVREARGYYQTGLEKLKREIAAKGGPIEDQAPGQLRHAYNETSTTLYDRLQFLFQAVDAGNAEINVPIYNGGLFITQADPSDTSPEAEVAHFLASCKIPDRQLALGLDRMARDLDEEKHDLVFIDYKSLGVRQLGSIYEGLLEFKLRVAPTEMAVVKGKKTEEVVPYAEALQKKLPILKDGRGKEARDKILPKGTVYLENDRRERKATGSYYTPDYIVKYIVEHTVGPVLQEKLEALRPVFREAEKTLRSYREKAEALKKQRMKSDDPERETYLHYRKTLNDVFFDLKVLDPAMGSGHFLVEAVDYITDRMADFLAAFRWTPIVYELSQTRHEIQEEMERQNVSIDMSKLTDLNLLKRRVLKSCIYGVDLNPMAVELAKVSLWLDCFTLGAPLSFLDHHMKCGNSLIGGRIDEARAAVEEGQLSLFGSNLWAGALLATKSMIEVGRLSDVTARQVRESKQHYHSATDALAPFKRILDIYVSRWFGNEPGQAKRGKAAVDKAIDFLRSNEANEWCQHPEHTAGLNDEQRTVVATATQAAQQQHFFHWELEFPEVFFEETKRKENGGFDAVVGNPPYRVLIRSQVGAELLQYYNLAYKAAQYNPNSFALMIERAISVSGFGAFISLIIPSLWLTNVYSSQLRRVMAKTCQILQLVELGFGVFDEIVETSIFLARKVSNSTDYEAILADRNVKDQQITPLPLKVSSKEIKKRTEAGFDFFSQKSDFRAKLDKNVEPLSKSFKVYRGVETRDNEKYLALSPLSASYKPILMGIDRYICEWAGMYVNFVPRELKSNADLSMYDVPEKVLLRRTGSQLLAGLDTQGLLAIKNLYLLLPKHSLSVKYLLALLNSNLLDQYNQAILANVGEAFAQLKKIDVEAFPIRSINFALSSDQRAYYLEKAKNLYQYCLDKNDQQCVLGFVTHHLSQQPEESDVVHDLLAFLAEEMIRLNKEKRATQREFLDWLVATLKILPDKEGRTGIDVLTGKAKLADYPGDYQKGEPALSTAEMLEILRKNKNRLGVSLNDIGLVNRIEKIYEESLQRVLPLKETLRKTDALIDAVVYRLYGLTEEEIKVIEGRG